MLAMMATGTNGGFAVIKARTKAGACPPGDGRIRTARPPQNDGAKHRIDGDRCCKNADSDDRRILKKCCGHAGAEADESAHRKIKIVDRHDQHLRDGRKCNRHRQIEQQVHAGIAHGPRLHVEDRNQQEGQRRGGNDKAKGVG